MLYMYKDRGCRGKEKAIPKGTALVIVKHLSESCK